MDEIFSWFLRSGVSRWGGCLSFFFASFFRFSVFLSPSAPLVFARFVRFFCCFLCFLPL